METRKSFSDFLKILIFSIKNSVQIPWISIEICIETIMFFEDFFLILERRVLETSSVAGEENIVCARKGREHKFYVLEF